MADLDPVLEKVLTAIPFQLTTDGGPEEARQRFSELPRNPVHPEVATTDQSVEGPAGPVGVRVYRPPTEKPALPVVVFIHGGGWSVGDLDTYDGTARIHAVGAEAVVVVSVDYRLAPEHPYPAAIDDVWAATQWVARNAGRFGGDPDRLAVAGDSAGGNLAAVVAQLARDAGTPLRFQLLWYPSPTFDTSLPSFAENADAPILGLAACKGFTRWYVAGTDLSQPPATLVPAVGDLAGLPAAYVAVAGHDPLRDDGIRYAELLAGAGVPAEVHRAKSLVHGFLAYHGVVPAATEALPPEQAETLGRQQVFR